MSNIEHILQSVRAGYKIRFREEYYGSIYAFCYPRSRLYPRFLLRFRRGVKLNSVEVAQIKAEIRRQRVSAAVGSDPLKEFSMS